MKRLTLRQAIKEVAHWDIEVPRERDDVAIHLYQSSADIAAAIERDGYYDRRDEKVCIWPTAQYVMERRGWLVTSPRTGCAYANLTDMNAADRAAKFIDEPAAG